MEATWDNAVLSFGVTDQALTADGVLIELCSGSIGAQDLIASGSIPGDVTMQLICRLRSERFERNLRSADAGDGAAASASSGSLAVDVRLFATAGGKEVGTCTLNFKFKPDDGDEAASRKESIQAEARRAAETSAPAAPVTTAPTLASTPKVVGAPEVVTTESPTGAGGAIEGTERRQSSLILLEETARHIEAIEEVRRWRS